MNNFTNVQFEAIFIAFFFIREWKEKIDLIDDVDTDTVEFTERKTFYFSPEQTSPLTGNEEITMLHPLLAVRYFGFMIHKQMTYYVYFV